jgi:hypothetical protein
MALKHLPSYVSFLPPHLRKRAKEGFNYSAQAIPLAALGTVVVTVAIQNDSDFLWVDLTGIARDPAAVQTVFPNPAITIQVNDSGSGRNVFQQPLDWGAVVGTAELPGDFSYPYLAEMGGTLTVTFQNLGAQAYDVRCALRGIKVFQWDEGA